MFKTMIFTATLLLAIASASAKEFAAYAPPAGVYGPEVEIGAHLGPATFAIKYEAIGKTLVLAEVLFYGADGKLTRQEFNKSISIRTGDCIAPVKVRFKGVPTGSAVKVFVTP